MHACMRAPVHFWGVGRNFSAEFPNLLLSVAALAYPSTTAGISANPNVFGRGDSAWSSTVDLWPGTVFRFNASFDLNRLLSAAIDLPSQYNDGRAMVRQLTARVKGPKD